LGAGRRAIVHFHRLDGRAGVLTVLASSRRAGAPVSVSASAGGPWVDTVLGGSAPPIAVRLPPRARRVGPPPGATSLVRVHEIGLRRPRTWRSELVRVLPALIGAIVLLALWRTGPVTATAWALLAALGTAGAWMALGDGAAALRFDRPVRDGLRLAGLAGV